MRHLAVDLFRHALFLEENDHRSRHFRHRCNINIHDPFGAQTRRRNIDTIFVDRHLARPHLIDQRKQGASEGKKGFQPVSRQNG